MLLRRARLPLTTLRGCTLWGSALKGMMAWGSTLKAAARGSVLKVGVLAWVSVLKGMMAWRSILKNAARGSEVTQAASPIVPVVAPFKAPPLVGGHVTCGTWQHCMWRSVVGRASAPV